MTVPNASAPVAGGHAPMNRPHYGVGPFGAVGRYFGKYATFSGRASRSEYWWAWLFVGT